MLKLVHMFRIHNQFMQNKNNMFTTTRSVPSQRYYRSVRYKINTTSTQDPNRSELTPHRNIHTFSSAKRHHPCAVFSNHTQPINANPQQMDQSLKVELKTPYLNTWHKLLYTKLEEQPVKASRVYLPNLIQSESSMFTALDPLALPFAHIQQGIEDLKSQLPKPKVEMNQIRSDLRHISSKIIKDIEQTQLQAIKGFQKLRKMIRIDQVEYQQNILRFKRNCRTLKQQDQAFKEDFQKTKPHLDNLQSEIFSNRPFQLTRNYELDHQFPQEYF